VRGQGNYVTREDIEARHAARLSDALSSVPGINLVRHGVHGGMAVRFMNSSVIRRDCVPQYWLDGVRADDVEIDDFSPSDIEGIELYQGPSTTPLQFSQGATTKCGAVVIWTRIPGT
jgi:outer membrane receptor for ferrienterochelin and colicin